MEARPFLEMRFGLSDRLNQRHSQSSAHDNVTL